MEVTNTTRTTRRRPAVALALLTLLAACGDDAADPSRVDCDRAIVEALDQGGTYADGWRLPDGCDEIYAETPDAVPAELRP